MVKLVAIIKWQEGYQQQQKVEWRKWGKGKNLSSWQSGFCIYIPYIYWFPKYIICKQGKSFYTHQTIVIILYMHDLLGFGMTWLTFLSCERKRMRKEEMQQLDLGQTTRREEEAKGKSHRKILFLETSSSSPYK